MKFKILVIYFILSIILLSACSKESSTESSKQERVILMSDEDNLIPQHLYTIPIPPVTIQHNIYEITHVSS